MTQPHTNPDYNIHFPLHPNIKITITFLDGDPDRPVIVDTLPNPVTSSPVYMPNANTGDKIMAHIIKLHHIQTKSNIIIKINDNITTNNTSLI
jgi:Uncharacterized protein conserved in bacteria